MPLSDSDFSALLKALQFAAEKHRSQKRKDNATPYINHPIEVTRLLWDNGVRDAQVLEAALLHDTVEDTGTSPDELRAAFGDTVAALVLEVSDDKSQPKPVRKQHQVDEAPTLSAGATLIKLADKINNVYSVAHLPPSDWSIQRKREYLDWAEKVVSGMRPVNARLEDLFDQTLAEARRLLDEPSSNQ